MSAPRWSVYSEVQVEQILTFPGRVGGEEFSVQWGPMSAGGQRGLISGWGASNRIPVQWGHISGEGYRTVVGVGVACSVRSNASSVMVTCDPLCTGTYDWKHYLPVTLIHWQLIVTQGISLGWNVLTLKFSKWTIKDNSWRNMLVFFSLIFVANV